MGGPGNINPNKVYYTMNEGMMCQRVKEDTPNAVSRKLTAGPKEGSLIWELRFNTMVGYLVDIHIKDGDYGLQWVYVIEWENIEYHINLNISCPAARSMFSRLRNIDFNKVIMLRSSLVTGEDDVERTYLTPWYDLDTKIDRYYTREESHDMPQGEKVMKKGKEEWDFEKQLAFMINEVLQVIIPKMRIAHPLSEAAVKESENKVANTDEAEEENPFEKDGDTPIQDRDGAPLPGSDDLPDELDPEADDLPF